MMVSHRVDFPAPLGPISTRNVPRSSVMLKPLSALKPSKSTVTPSTDSNSGVLAAVGTALMARRLQAR
jgi:hypothetical protein